MTRWLARHSARVFLKAPGTTTSSWLSTTLYTLAQPVSEPGSSPALASSHRTGTTPPTPIRSRSGWLVIVFSLLSALARGLGQHHLRLGLLDQLNLVVHGEPLP